MPKVLEHVNSGGREMLSRILIALWVFALLALLPEKTLAAIVNFSFESKVVTFQDNFEYYYAGDPAITGWSIIGNSVDLLRTPRWVAQNANQCVDLVGVSAGGIFQDVPTVPGQEYRLTFWLAGNPEFVGSTGGPFVKTGKLSWNGSTVANLSFDVTGKTNSNLGWTQYTYDLKATGATTRLQFEGTNAGIAGLLLDNVDLIPIPEPSTVGLLSVALLGVTCRRR
jgi:choice-of-anchor C domain-containing protein